jgi:hypothetical protein
LPCRLSILAIWPADRRSVDSNQNMPDAFPFNSNI